jgi:BirA family transcriptional regulator, biotin operon repressor / biotin---[acetyl-CoA-carboxylase] ligase
MESQLRKSLAGLPLGGIRFLHSVGSTNDAALAWAAEGAPDFSIVVADEQTSGRGRMGRKWFTPPGSALAVSLILRPGSLEGGNIPLFSGLGALALVDALKAFGVAAQIKWPNDVLISGRKTAGVLVETAWMGDRAESIVLGMGVNVSPASVPPEAELNFPATCIQAEGPGAVERFGLLREWLVCLLKWRPRLGTGQFLQAWQDALAFRGESVRVWVDETEPIVGVVEGLEADGSLRVTANGAQRIIRFGEIHLRPL